VEEQPLAMPDRARLKELVLESRWSDLDVIGNGLLHRA
jgi:hypothetical protein